jgi:hypothetical protein
MSLTPAPGARRYGGVEVRPAEEREALVDEPQRVPGETAVCEGYPSGLVDGLGTVGPGARGRYPVDEVESSRELDRCDPYDAQRRVSADWSTGADAGSLIGSTKR